LQVSNLHGIEFDRKSRLLLASRGSVTRVRRNGSLDPTFGHGGHAAFPGTPLVAVDPAGRIVLAGSSGDRVRVTRLKTNGAPDSRFGKHGTVVVSRHGFLEDVAVTANRVFVAYQDPPHGKSRTDRIVAVDRRGRRDRDFGIGGAVSNPFGPQSLVGALAIGPPNRLLAVGNTCSLGALEENWSAGGSGASYDSDDYGQEGCLDNQDPRVLLAAYTLN
jgi:hypothetical protein